ncbi:MAG: hypothetical protein U0452_06885 [Anaerolineae bacterium]
MLDRVMAGEAMMSDIDDLISNIARNMQGVTLAARSAILRQTGHLHHQELPGGLQEAREGLVMRVSRCRRALVNAKMRENLR